MKRPRVSPAVGRCFLAVTYVFAGLMHFLAPDAYLRVIPSFVPFPLECVFLSGALEALGGVGVLIPCLRRPAGWGLALLLVAVFPANIQMAWDAFAQARPLWAQVLLLARLPLQWPLILWVIRAAELFPTTRDADHQL